MRRSLQPRRPNHCRVDKVGVDRENAKVLTEIDRGGEKLVIDTGDGTRQTFRLAGHATEDAGKDIAKGTVKGSKVTIYYTEDAGEKVAHFFE